MSDQPLAGGGRFSHPGALLAFLAAVAGARLAATATCRGSVVGDWWADVPAPWSAVAELVWAAGGQPYAGSGGEWRALSPAGDPPPADAERLDVNAWPVWEPARLLAVTPLRPRYPSSAEQLEVVVPGALGRWVLQRALALHLQVRLRLVSRRPLDGTGTTTGALWLRLQAVRGPVPQSLLRALTALPYTLVAQAVGTGDQQLLVDIRQCPPLPEGLLPGWTSPTERWVLGTADTGHWRLQLLGQEVDGASLLAAPAVPVTAVVDPATAVTLPAPLPVRLVTRRGGSVPRPDAVLLDDAELHWLRLFLAGRPAGERAFLLPGPGRHLLLAPAGLTEVLPFGTPLTRVGPGGLYLEQGLTFAPPLPAGARQRAFRTGGEQVVAVMADGAYGFDRTQLVPAWTLWLGASPPVQAGLSPDGRQLLAHFDRSLRVADELPVELEPATTPTVRQPSGDRPRLLEEALRAELNGDLVRAAELLEAAGELAGAGRLYEQAAAQADH